MTTFDAFGAVYKYKYHKAIRYIIPWLGDKTVFAGADKDYGGIRRADFAAEILEMTLKIHTHRGAFYGYRGEWKERDQAIAEWQQWWEKNQDKTPEQWRRDYFDDLFDRLLIERENRSDIAEQFYRDSGDLYNDVLWRWWSNAPKQADAAVEIAADLWFSERDRGVDEALDALRVFDVLTEPVVQFRQTFIFGPDEVRAMEHPSWEAAPTPTLGPITARRAEIDRAIEALDAGLPDAELRPLAETLRRTLLTDFLIADLIGLEVEQPEYYAAARKATSETAIAFAKAWWRTHGNKPNDELIQEVIRLETLIQFGRFYLRWHEAQAAPPAPPAVPG